MSEPARLGNEGRDWRLYVDDMISFAEKVLAYIEGLGLTQILVWKIGF